MTSGRVLVSTLLALLVVCSGTARADIGSIARRGDNCTPINGFAIGYPVPGRHIPGGSIVNEAVILANGWDPVGWILTTRDGHLALTAYHPSGTEQATIGVPPIIALPSASTGTVRSTYNSFRDEIIRAGTDRRFLYSQELKSFTVSPCFTAPLPKGA